MKKYFLLVLSIIVLSSSCKKDDPGIIIIDPCGIDFETTVHLTIFGDDFSQAVHIEEDEAWPTLVDQFIEDQGYILSESTPISEYGIKTSELDALLNGNPNVECKNLVALMIGVNDQLEGRTTSQFESDYSNLLNTAISIAGSAQRVVSVTLPDYSITPGLPSSAGTPEEALADIEAYNTVIRTISEERGTRLADIFPISQSAYQILYVPEDSFHADADHHRLWANVISAEILQSLD